MSLLIDSDVLVWLTRGHAGASQRLHAVNPWRVSVVTYIELAQGCRDAVELARLKKGLAAQRTEVLPLTPEISQRAAGLIDELALSHGNAYRASRASACELMCTVKKSLIKAEKYTN